MAQGSSAGAGDRLRPSLTLAAMALASGCFNRLNRPSAHQRMTLPLAVLFAIILLTEPQHSAHHAKMICLTS